ncbi:Rv3654c family TadE-like protein [Streptomyces sp. NPDC056773]|uniref:Rv3654c family TadE-like protein n=1 Tax=unclassified Streptomyces TaxID=2593676 RepID=UPI003675D27D
MTGAARADARDRGSATVWGVVVATVLVAVFGGVLLLGQAVVSRHRAGAAADLAALAAAVSWAHGPEAACATAARVAGAQGAQVTGCAVTGEVAEVTTRAPTGPFGPELRSRAGPPPPAPLDEGASTSSGRPDEGPPRDRAAPVRSPPW